LSLLKAPKEGEGHQRDENANPGEGFPQAVQEHSQLAQKSSQVSEDIDRIGLLILASAQSSQETINCAGIIPLHRGVSHARQRQVEIKGSTGKPKQAEHQDRFPLAEQSSCA